MKRLDTASIDEEGSSRSTIGGLPVKLVKVYQTSQLQFTDESDGQTELSLVSARQFRCKAVFIGFQPNFSHNKIHVPAYSRNTLGTAIEFQMFAGRHQIQGIKLRTN